MIKLSRKGKKIKKNKISKKNVLTRNKNTKKKLLSRNKLILNGGGKLTEEELKAILKKLKKNDQALSELNLAEKQLYNQDVVNIFKVLETNKTLTELNLSKNTININTWINVINALKQILL